MAPHAARVASATGNPYGVLFGRSGSVTVACSPRSACSETVAASSTNDTIASMYPPAVENAALANANRAAIQLVTIDTP